jgi:hypothetical protein
MIECDCQQPGFCPHYQRQFTRRQWEIARGIRISEGERKLYLDKWEQELVEKGGSPDQGGTFHASPPTENGCHCNRGPRAEDGRRRVR